MQPSNGARCLILVRPFIYFSILCVQTVKALARLHGCAGSPEPSLVAYVISTSHELAQRVFHGLMKTFFKIYFVIIFQPFISSDAVVYTLASGHRRVLVKPVNQCVEKCKSQLVIMEPGDSRKYLGNGVLRPKKYICHFCVSALKKLGMVSRHNILFY